MLQSCQDSSSKSASVYVVGMGTSGPVWARMGGGPGEFGGGEEIPLADGSMTTVVRVGDTVRRPVGRWTPAVHSLLRHLEAVGFEGAPRVLGFDD